MVRLAPYKSNVVPSQLCIACRYFGERRPTLLLFGTQGSKIARMLPDTTQTKTPGEFYFSRNNPLVLALTPRVRPLLVTKSEQNHSRSLGSGSK